LRHACSLSYAAAQRRKAFQPSPRGPSAGPSIETPDRPRDVAEKTNERLKHKTQAEKHLSARGIRGGRRRRQRLLNEDWRRVAPRGSQRRLWVSGGALARDKCHRIDCAETILRISNPRNHSSLQARCLAPSPDAHLTMRVDLSPQRRERSREGRFAFGQNASCDTVSLNLHIGRQLFDAARLRKAAARRERAVDRRFVQ
jgi:hypothetical protein